MPRPNSGGIVTNTGPAFPKPLPAFSAGGDLVGGLTSQEVRRIRGAEVQTAAPNLTPGYVLTATDVDKVDWAPGGGGGGGSPTGPAGGNLYGTYPNPQVGHVNDMPVENAVDAEPWDHLRAVPEEIPFDDPVAVVTDGSSIWVGSAITYGLVTRAAASPASAVYGNTSLPSSQALRMEQDGSSIFVTTGGPQIWVIDKLFGGIVGIGIVPDGFSTEAVTVIGDNVYVTSWDPAFVSQGRVHRFSKTAMLSAYPGFANPVVTQTQDFPQEGSDLTTDGTRLFMSSQSGPTLTRLNTTTLVAAETYNLSTSPYRLHFAHGSIWMSGDSNVYRFDPLDISSGPFVSVPGGTQNNVTQTLGITSNSSYVFVGGSVSFGQSYCLTRIDPNFNGALQQDVMPMVDLVYPAASEFYVFIPDKSGDRVIVQEIGDSSLHLVEGGLSLRYIPGDVKFQDGSLKSNLVSTRTIQSNTSVGVQGVVNLSSDSQQTGVGAEGNYATMLGGDQNRIHGGSFNIIVAGSLNEIRSGFGQFSHWGAISAGRDNIIDCGSSDPFTGSNFNTIVGGESNTIQGQDMQGNTILGGRYNTISYSSHAFIMGYNSSANGNYSVVVGGQSNHTGAEYAAVLGGLQGHANGPNSVVLGGVQQTTSFDATYSTVLAGLGGFASRFAQMVHSAGQINSSGQLQFSRYFVWGYSSGGPQELFDSGGFQALNLEPRKAYAIRATCLANSSDAAQNAMFVHYLLAHRGPSGPAILDVSTPLVTAANGTGWSVDYSVNGSDEYVHAIFTTTLSTAAYVLVTYEFLEVYGF